MKVAWLWIQVINAFVKSSLRMVAFGTQKMYGMWLDMTKHVNKYLSSLTTAKHVDGSPFRCTNCGAGKGPGCCAFCLGKSGIMLPWIKFIDMHVCLIGDCPVKSITTALLADHYSYQHYGVQSK